MLPLLLLAGCGGSHSTESAASTSAAAPAQSTAAATTATTGSPGPTATTTSTTSTASTTSVTSTTGHPTAAPGSARTSPAPPSGARIPATFKIGPGGVLSPPTVSAPAGIAVELRVTSGDGKAHKVVLRLARPVTLSVPAGGHAAKLLSGIRVGTYVLDVDGAPRGGLTIGAVPGP